MKKGISFGNGVGIVCEIGVVCCLLERLFRVWVKLEIVFGYVFENVSGVVLRNLSCGKA